MFAKNKINYFLTNRNQINLKTILGSFEWPQICGPPTASSLRNCRMAPFEPHLEGGADRDEGLISCLGAATCARMCGVFFLLFLLTCPATNSSPSSKWEATSATGSRFSPTRVHQNWRLYWWLLPSGLMHEGEPWPSGCHGLPTVCPRPRRRILEFPEDIKRETSQWDIDTLKPLRCDACPTTNRGATYFSLHPHQPDDYQTHSRLFVFSYFCTGNCFCNFRSGTFIIYFYIHNDDKHWLHDICYHTAQALLLVSTNSTEWSDVNLQAHPQAFLAVCLSPVKRWSFIWLTVVVYVIHSLSLDMNSWACGSHMNAVLSLS